LGNPTLPQLEITVLKKRTKILGEDHPETLRSMSNLACDHWLIGDFHSAKELGIIVLKKRTETLGEDHPDTLRSMGVLAETYAALGKVARAQQLLTKTFMKQLNILGAYHPNTLDTMSDLAETYYELGKWDDAEHLFLASLIFRSKTDQNRTHILGGMCNLAKVYVRKGFLEEPAILQETGTEDLTRIFNRNHSHVLEVTLQLCSTHRGQGRLEEAERLGVDVADRLLGSKSFGKGHPTTLRAQAELTMTYRGPDVWKTQRSLARRCSSSRRVIRV
jgi:hypothetical protein